MKHWEIIVVICSILFFGFLFSRDSLANLVWQKYRRPDVALVLAVRDTKLLMNLGNYYFNGGAYDLEKSKQAYEKAIGASTSTPPLWAHYQLGRIYFVEGDFERALEEVNKELEAYPGNF